MNVRRMEAQGVGQGKGRGGMPQMKRERGEIYEGKKGKGMSDDAMWERKRRDDGGGERWVDRVNKGRRERAHETREMRSRVRIGKARKEETSGIQRETDRDWIEEKNKDWTTTKRRRRKAIRVQIRKEDTGHRVK